MYTNYEELAFKLNEKCKRRKSFEFYNKLYEKHPGLLEKLKKVADTTKVESSKIRKVDWSLNDMIDISLDFYQNFDEETFMKIEKVLHDRQTVFECTEPREEGGDNSITIG